jgi:hypothetical protein
MRYSLFFAFITMCAGTIVSDPAFMVGVNGNATSITGSDTSVQSSALRPGLGVKIGFEQNFSEHFSLIIGAGFDSRGEQNTLSKNLTPTVRQETIENIDILCLQVPVLAQFNLPLGLLRVSLFGGPDLGVFLNGEKHREKKVYVSATNDQPARVDVTKDTINFSRDMKMLDCGLTAGFGLEFKTGVIGSIFLRPSVYIGLLDILQTGHNVENNVNLNGKHQAFSVALGYKFNITPKMCSTATYKSTPVLEAKSSSVNNGGSGYNPDNYKSGSSSEESSPASEPVSDANDQE